MTEVRDEKGLNLAKRLSFSDINLVEGFRQYTTQSLPETTNIAFDCQYFKELPVKDSSQMAAQVDMCLNVGALHHPESRKSPPCKF